MKHTLLNLNEGSFPIKLDKKLKDLYGLEGLGEIKDHINVKLNIEKYNESKKNKLTLVVMGRFTRIKLMG